jgi:hypothetical protein
MIVCPSLYSGGEQNEPRRIQIEPMHRGEIRQMRHSLEPDKQRSFDMLPAGCHRYAVRFVRDYDFVIAIKDCRILM